MRSEVDTDYRGRQHGEFQNQTSYSEEEVEEQEEGEEGDDPLYQYPEETERNRFEDSYGYGDADAVTDEDEDMGNYDSENHITGTRSNGRYYEQSNSDLLLEPATGLRASNTVFPNSNGSFSASPKPSAYGKIAKSLYSRMGVPAIDETDELVLNTEKIITSLYHEGLVASENDYKFQQALTIIPEQLRKIWTEYDKRTAYHHSEEYIAAIGPGHGASNFAKANFLANLALQIYHPNVDDLESFEPKIKPLPQVILEWMDDSHNPYPAQVEEVQAHKPSPSHHPQFWDIVRNGLLRGQVVAVLNVLKTAGWKYAKVETDGMRHSSNQIGYTGLALANVEKVIGALTQVLSQCPAVHGDWNIRGSEWTLFRLRASTALDDLKNFAEGRNRDRDEFESDDFGNSAAAARSGNYSRTAKKAESQVPWEIYQNLLALYDLIVGESNAIIANATDWCEATMGLLVWWDEGKEDRRLALGRSRGSRRNPSKDLDSEIYLRKLRRSFDITTADSTDFAVNTNDEVEVSLASLLEGDNEALMGFLRGWSGPVSSAIAEVASLAGWLPPAEPQSLINMDLDQDDMELLGITSSPSKTDSIKDLTLITYARTLAKHGQFKAQGFLPRDGWELAIALLGRLDSVPRSEEMVGDFLQRFPLDSSSTVDRLWNLLNNIGMTRHAENTTELYANSLAEGSHRYGEALWYYALSHKTQKVKDVLDLLISFSLIQSTAYPPESELDDHLRRLISSPKSALLEISSMDVDAAELLQKMLSGYATLRKFYVLRDEEVQQPNGRKSKSGTITRKLEATSALLAVITSSDDNIRGGLYDEDRGAVVSVDFLLALLGEAMVLVNQSDFNLTVPQIDILLKAIEDLQAVGPRVYSACTEFLQTVVSSTPGLKGSSPADMLRKSTSNISGTSSFSLVGSSMAASQLKQSMSSSGVLVRGNIKRGWDWRQGISANTTGDDVLRILRLGLAKTLATAWLSEVDNKM